MNIKLNNEDRDQDILDPEPYSSAEERRRTGRYVAILVGISLVCLAIYHAWVRKVAVLASLLVPALIMLLYIAWVLYTASRDKRKVFDPEHGMETMIGLLPRPPASNVDIIPAESPPSNSSSVVSPAKSPSSGDTKHQNVKKTSVTSKVPPQQTTKDKQNITKKIETKTPKDRNSPKEFRRCYSIA